MNQNNQSPLSLIKYEKTTSPMWVSVDVKGKDVQESRHVDWTGVAISDHMQAEVVRGQKAQVSRKSGSVQ